MLQISTTDLAIAILIILAGVLTIYIVTTLRKFNKTLENINALLDENRKNLRDSIESLPGICDNMSSVTGSLKNKVDSIGCDLSAREETASALDVESFISAIASAIDLFSEVKGMFRGNKKRYHKK